MMTLEQLPIQSYILYKPQLLPENWFYQVTLERRLQRDGSSKWGIYKNESVFYKSIQEFQYERSSSNTTSEDLEDTRFSTAQEAFEFWKTFENKYIETIK